MTCCRCGHAINEVAEAEWAKQLLGYSLSAGSGGPDSVRQYYHSNAWQCIAAALIAREAARTQTHLTQTPESYLPFSRDEKQVFDSITSVMEQIQLLDDRGRLKTNQEELTRAIHALQQFPIQHMLHRRWPEYFGDWYEQPLRERLGGGE